MLSVLLHKVIGLNKLTDILFELPQLLTDALVLGYKPDGLLDAGLALPAGVPQPPVPINPAVHLQTPPLLPHPQPAPTPQPHLPDTSLPTLTLLVLPSAVLGQQQGDLLVQGIQLG